MRHVTIKDIAHIAGVSTSTVSRALSGSKELSEATRERIVKICNEQGYRVNALARSLIRSRTNVIGLIVPEVTNPFYAEISLGIETHARELGYNVMLCNSQQDTKTTEELFGFLISHQVDGIILANSHSDAPRWLQQFAPHLPTVLLGTPASLSGDEVNSVCVDNLAGGRLAAEYLLSLGHRSIAYLGHRSNSLTHQLRLRGFMEVLGQVGLTPTVIENNAESSSIGAGYELSRKLFNEGCPHRDFRRDRLARPRRHAGGGRVRRRYPGRRFPSRLRQYHLFVPAEDHAVHHRPEKVPARRGCGRYPHPDHRVR